MPIVFRRKSLDGCHELNFRNSLTMKPCYSNNGLYNTRNYYCRPSIQNQSIPPRHTPNLLTREIASHFCSVETIACPVPPLSDNIDSETPPFVSHPSDSQLLGDIDAVTCNDMMMIIIVIITIQHGEMFILEEDLSGQYYGCLLGGIGCHMTENSGEYTRVVYEGRGEHFSVPQELIVTGV